MVLPESDRLHILEKEFGNTGLSGTYLDTTCYAVSAPKEWDETWADLYEVLTTNNFTNPKAAVIPSHSNRPTLDDVMPNLESIDRINSISKNLWLGEAILNNRLESHFQPIIDRSGQVMGYEAFARARMESGEIVSGGKIIAAARELNIQHLVDKLLHIMAIKSFANAKLQGNLFINFMTGFIQLPAKYLEGMTEAVKHYNIFAKRIALDVSDSENVRDLNQLSSIIEFCHSKGYSVALDDINSLSVLKTIMKGLRASPDFIKLDRLITQNTSSDSVFREICSLTQLAHEKGSIILAEGIETEEVQKLLTTAGVDLFQGYHIAAPMPVSQLKSINKAAS